MAVGPTRMNYGDGGSAPLAGNVALFAEATRGDNDVLGQLSGDKMSPEAVMRMIKEGRDFVDNGNPEKPIINITDLREKKGSKVGVDLMHARVIQPVMGDAQIGEQRGSTTFSSQDFKLDQFVFPWNGGGNMAQQNTPYDLRKAGVAQMTRSAREYLRQLTLIHLAGARGQDDALDWVIPMADHPNFAKLVINPLLAPSVGPSMRYTRHLFAGEAASLDEMDDTCFLTFEDIARLAVHNREHRHPMPRVVVPNDPAAETEPLGVLLVTERVWYHLKSYYGTNNRDWVSFQQAAGQRGSQNPLFKGSLSGMIDGILVKTMPRPIRFGQGTTMTVATSAAKYTETTATVPEFKAGGDPMDYAVDRCIFLGGSAIAKVWGRNLATGVPVDFYEGKINDGRMYVSSLGGIGGVGKLRFESQEGVDIDHGVTVIDCYAPNPQKVRNLAAPVQVTVPAGD